MILKNLFVVFVCMSAGTTIAMSTFAFIEKIGFIPRITARTKTATYVHLYQNLIVFGVIVGNIWSLFRLSIPVYVIGAMIFGLFSGMYAGCLTMAIAETLDFIPYFFYKSKLKLGLSIVILAIALGKGFGSLFQVFLTE